MIENDFPENDYTNVTIDKTKVTKLRVSGIPSIDPVSVILEDLDTNQGKLTFECYGKAYSAYWGAMGSNLIDFIGRVSPDYIIGCVSPGLRHWSDDYEAVPDWLKKILLKRRRGRELGREAARELWDWVEDCAPSDKEGVDYHAMYNPDSQIDKICDNNEWFRDLPTCANTDYTYLQRIVEAVKHAVKAAGTEKVKD